MSQSLFRLSRRIEFADTDLGGIVHFARYFVFMETTEHEFLRSLGTPVHFELDGREIAWPRVSATCDYKSPARYGDVLDIALSVARLGTKSMTYELDIRVGDRQVAIGKVTSVCCVMGRNGLEAISIPEPIVERIRTAEAEALRLARLG